jgi:hypothetical protein
MNINQVRVARQYQMRAKARMVVTAPRLLSSLFYRLHFASWTVTGTARVIVSLLAVLADGLAGGFAAAAEQRILESRPPAKGG